MFQYPRKCIVPYSVEVNIDGEIALYVIDSLVMRREVQDRQEPGRVLIDKIKLIACPEFLPADEKRRDEQQFDVVHSVWDEKFGSVFVVEGHE